MNTIKPWIIGHRGARGIYPENSLIAFSEAVKLGVNGLEMDLQISQDGKVVVTHDPVISRNLCSVENPFEEPIIYNLPYSKIKKLVCGLSLTTDFPHQKKIKTHIPLLSEVMETCGKTAATGEPLWYFLEIKSTPQTDNLHHPTPAIFTIEVLKIIKEYNLEKQTFIISFDERILMEIKKQNEPIKTGFLFETPEKLKEITANANFPYDAICPLFTFIDKEFLDFTNEKNIPVIPWTVNENKDIVKMLKLQVAGIITDYPDMALKMRNENG